MTSLVVSMSITPVRAAVRSPPCRVGEDLHVDAVASVLPEKHGS
jgi:hypothetical protein